MVSFTLTGLLLQGSVFVIAVFLQQVRGFNAIETGLTLIPIPIGILISGALAGGLAKRFPQKTLIWVGFVVTITGLILLLVTSPTSSILAFIACLVLMGLGVGVMLTFSVNVVQSSFPDKDQGEISGLSRSLSNLGFLLGIAIASSVLVTTLVPVNQTYPLALMTMIVLACIGLIAALLLPREPAPQEHARAELTVGGP